MKYLVLFTACVFGMIGDARAQNTIVRDTSFTVYSAFTKASKKQPFIKIVYPVIPKGVSCDSNIAYCNYGARILHLDVCYPTKKSRKNKPAVLLIHGGGWRSGDRSQQMPLALQLAAHGYIAVVAEYRLSPEAPYPAAVYDLKAAIRWIRANATKYNVDTHKIAALGCSAGGQLAALLGTANHIDDTGKIANKSHSSKIEAVVDIDGILAFIHPESGEGDDSKGKSAATYWFGTTKTETPWLWQEASPLTHVDKATAPFLFINSSVARMHAGRNDMMSKLDSLHIYNEVHTFPDAPHPFWLFDPWFDPTVKYTVAFLDNVFDVKK